MDIIYDANGLPTAEGLPPKLDTEQAVEFFQLEKKTLWRLASQGNGPPCYKLGKNLWWPTAQGVAWLQQQVRWRTPATTEAQAAPAGAE